MIKPGEYIQLLEFFSFKSNFIYDYSIRETNKDENEAIARFDELRSLHADFAKECELYSIYANLDLRKLNLLRQEIIEVATKFKIEVGFTQYNSLEFRKGKHAWYKYLGIDISNLFVFYIKRKRSYISGV